MKKHTFILSALALSLFAFSTGTLAAITFTDVPTNHWAAKAIEAGKASGLWKGYDDGTFQPNKAMSRAEVAVLVDNNNKMMEQKMRQMMGQTTPVSSTPTSAQFKTTNGVTFSHPASWDVFSLNIGANDAVAKSFNENGGFSSISDIKTVGLNYIKKPANAEQIDMELVDLVFEKSPESNLLYLKALTKNWPDSGVIESYTSKTGQEYAVWKGDGPVFEGKYTVYVTQYIDRQNQQHWLQISAIGNTLSDIESNLKPVVDSLQIWNNFVKENMNFSVQYPKNWTKSEEESFGNYHVFFTNELTKESFGILPKGELDTDLPQASPVVTQVVLDGRKATKSEWKLENEKVLVKIKFSEYPASWNADNRLEFSGSKASLADFEDILSTFHFTD